MIRVLFEFRIKLIAVLGRVMEVLSTVLAIRPKKLVICDVWLKGRSLSIGKTGHVFDGLKVNLRWSVLQVQGLCRVRLSYRIGAPPSE